MGTNGKGQQEVYRERLAKANKAAMNCHLITVTVLSIAYLAEVIKGSKGGALFSDDRAAGLCSGCAGNYFL